MSTFGEIAKATKNINTKTILKEVLKDRAIEAYIFTTIRSRVISKGITGTNEKLKTDESPSGQFYSYYTQFLKEKHGSGAGRITDHVTLWGDGTFWGSLKFEILENSMLIDADFIKSDGHMYRNFETQFASKKEFEDAVLSLTDTEMQKLLKEYIEPKFIKLFYEKL